MNNSSFKIEIFNFKSLKQFVISLESFQHTCQQNENNVKKQTPETCHQT